MRKIASTFLIVLISFSFIRFANSADEKIEKIDNNETELNFFTGMFDFSDDNQASGLVGIQHQNDELFRKSFLGNLSPITGAFLTEKNAVYLYTGVEGQYGIGPLKILPSFTPGYYEKGDGKDLGSVLEFKSEVKIGLDIFENSKLSYSYSHISNNDWGDTNPGTENQHITFSTNF